MNNLPTDIQLGRLTVHCAECLTRFRVDRFVPFFDATKISFCVVCGQQKLTFREPDSLTLWQEVAEQLGLSVELTREAYELWDGTPARFIDFVRELVNDSDESSS